MWCLIPVQRTNSAALSPSVNYPARGDPGGRCALHGEARDGPWSPAEGGAGVRGSWAEHPVSPSGHQLTQSPGAAPQTGRAGGVY